jgi:ABC-type glutathione transport system ATPase component
MRPPDWADRQVADSVTALSPAAARSDRDERLTKGLPVMDALIELSKVTKRYVAGGAPALDRVSLGVAAGEAVAVMGPSGSGKSTLLNLVAGLDKPTRGMVMLAGQRVDTLSETKLARYRRRFGRGHGRAAGRDPAPARGNPGSRPLPADLPQAHQRPGRRAAARLPGS